MKNPFLTYEINTPLGEPIYKAPNVDLSTVFSDFDIPENTNFQDIKKPIEDKKQEEVKQKSKQEPYLKQETYLSQKPITQTEVKVGGGDKKKFIKDFTPYAERIAKETGLNKDFILAKTGLETGWGKAMHGYNFGNIITGKYWKGDYIDRGDHNAKGEKITQRFRKYNNLDDATSDYIKFMKGKRYKHLSGLSAEDAAKAIQSTGYAEDPNYSKTILNILKTLYK